MKEKKLVEQPKLEPVFPCLVQQTAKQEAYIEEMIKRDKKAGY